MSQTSAPPPDSDLYSWSARPPQPAPRDRHWMIAVAAVVVIGLVVACGLRILYVAYSAGASKQVTPADVKALLVPSIGSNGPIPECSISRHTYTAAQRAAQLIAVSTLMVPTTGERQTIGDGEAFSSPGPEGTINIELGYRHKFVFVVEAANAGAPEVPLDDIAKQQYDRL